jgi:sigma-B regulation protein RsbU (phosphoserine phosphatase)
MPVLTIHPTAGKPYPFEMPDGKIVIGRSSKNDVVLKDPCCSSYHASVYPVPGGYALKDMGSKNGTFLNERPVTGEVELKNGDEIQIGDTRIVFRAEALRQSSETIIQVKNLWEEYTAGRPGPSPSGPKGRADSGPRRKEDSLLDEVISALSANQPLEEYLGHIMDVLIRHIPMERGILMLKDESRGDLVPRVVRNPRGSGQAEDLPISWSVIRRALDEGNAILISDLTEDEAMSRAVSVIRYQIHSAICVPLYDHGEVLGVIYADRISALGEFNRNDLRNLSLMAGIAARRIREVETEEALVDQEAIRRQLKEAEEIQRKLLPERDPDFAPFDISGSARACYDVGGDYFDYVSLGPDRLGLVIADVSGSGVGAAFLMARLSGALHREIKVTEDLAVLTADLNDDVHEISEINAFISFFLGVVDRNTGEMTYVNAGHNPPFILDGRDRVEALKSTGLCLGMFPATTYETRTVTLGPGSLLCIYTDGVVESRNKKREEFGEERFLETLRESAGLPAREIVTKVYESVFEFTKNPKPEDDISLIVLKR